jgi:hypothetical protein
MACEYIRLWKSEGGLQDTFKEASWQYRGVLSRVFCWGDFLHDMPESLVTHVNRNLVYKVWHLRLLRIFIGVLPIFSANTRHNHGDSIGLCVGCFWDYHTKLKF